MTIDVIIPGATTSTRTLVPADVGKILFCKVKATNAFGFAFADSNELGPITGSGVPSPPSGGVPNIADVTPQVDEILHVTSGTWAGYPAPTFAYEWHRVTVDAPAPPSGGVPNIADITPQVSETLHVTAGTWAGVPAPTFSYEWHRVTPDPVAPSGGTPSIADTTPVEGETLHCDHGTWAGDAPITYVYQWRRGGTGVGTDSADYTLVSADIDANMSCIVTAFNAAGSSSPTASNVVGPVTALPVAPSNTGAPSIADLTPEVDETLHVTDGTWSGVPAPTFSYQWFQVGTAANITSSATASNVENTVLAHALTADQSVTWSVVGGADISRFEISGSTLRWFSNGTKNFEAPNDADLNNAYVVVVRATATTGQTTNQTVTVTVTDVVESTLTFDFTADTSTIAGAASTSTAPLTVTRTGTAAWAEKLDGTWQNFAANIARRTDKGLLLEEARTNVCLQNRTQTNASWVKTTCTAAKNQVGIDGAANSACSLTATAGNSTCLNTTTIASSVRFTTAFVKRLVGTGTIEMTQNGGTLWTAITVTGAWTRVSIPSVTLANPVVGFRIVTSGDSIAVDFVQNENGAFATSPITTTTAAVARPADVIVINTTVAPIVSWINETVGTLYAEGAQLTGAIPTAPVFQIDAGATSNSHAVFIPATGTNTSVATTTTSGGLVGSFTAIGAAGTNKIAWAYKLNDMAGSFNGGTVGTDAVGVMPTGMTTVRLGKGSLATPNWNGYLRKITFYNGRMSNADLVTLTTP